MDLTYCLCFAERSWLGQTNDLEHLFPVLQIFLVFAKDVVEFLDKRDAKIVPKLSGLVIRPAEVITHAIELIEKGLLALVIKPFEVGEVQVHRMVCIFPAGHFPRHEVIEITSCASAAVAFTKLAAQPLEVAVPPGSLGCFLDFSSSRPKEVVFKLKMLSMIEIWQRLTCVILPGEIASAHAQPGSAGLHPHPHHWAYCRPRATRKRHPLVGHSTTSTCWIF